MSYWVIQPFLPRETRSYVPAFMAVTYLMEYAEAHGIVPDKPAVYYQETDTVTVRDVLAFDQVSELHGIPMETLRLLNPSFIRDIIPAGNGQHYTIRLPRASVPRFIALEDSVYRHVTRKGLEHQALQAEVKKAEERTVHVVRSGESLGSIARKYGCRVNDLMAWNDLRSTRIYPRQRLIVFSRASVAAAAPQKEPTRAEAPVAEASTGVPTEQATISSGITDRFVYYTIQSGDTLWDIAKRYEGVSVDDIRAANNIRSDYRLRPGQKIKVPVKS